MLELRDLSYQSATAASPVLRQINLQLALGTPGLVAGPSGCGKTTLLEVISVWRSPRPARSAGMAKGSTVANGAGCAAWSFNFPSAIS
jgi:ABC-type lipoprotein export system ATPase subunit